jgi:hypothetical protein
MLATTALATCRERTALDWIGAVSLDLLTLAWVGLLVAWWVA